MIFMTSFPFDVVISCYIQNSSFIMFSPSKCRITDCITLQTKISRFFNFTNQMALYVSGHAMNSCLHCWNILHLLRSFMSRSFFAWAIKNEISNKAESSVWDDSYTFVYIVFPSFPAKTSSGWWLMWARFLFKSRSGFALLKTAEQITHWGLIYLFYLNCRKT